MARSATPRRTKPKRTVIVTSTMPDADDPRNGYEAMFEDFVDGEDGNPARRLAVVEYIGVKHEAEFGDDGREIVRIRAERARFPQSSTDVQALASMLDRLQSAAGGQGTLED